MDDYRRLAKVANQRMRELERNISKHGAHEAPVPYQTAQARLENIGVRKTAKSPGFRFPERMPKGYSKEQAAAVMREVERFTQAQTSTWTGYEKARNDSFNTADAKYDLSGKGISKDMWGDMWGKFKANHKDRMLSSDTVIRAVKAYMYKNQDTDPEDLLSGEEIGEMLSNEAYEQDVWDDLGIDADDIESMESGEDNPFDDWMDEE